MPSHRLTTLAMLATLLASLTLAATLAGCVEDGLHAPPIHGAEERSLLELQSAEAMESNEALGPPALHGATLVEVIALRRRLSPSQRASADVWIAERISLFRQVYARSRPATFPRECPFRQAERAFAAWVIETGSDRHPEVFTELYTMPDEVLPTLDRFALAVDLLPRDPAMRDAFVAVMARSPDKAQRLAAELKKRGDPALAERVFSAVLAPKPAAACPTASWAERVGLPGFVRLWKASFADRPTWEAGARALAASAPTLGDPDRAARALLQEAWRIGPDRRATLLFVIASAADPGRYAGEGSAARFEAEIGPRATEDEMAAAAAMKPSAAARPATAATTATTHGGGPCFLPTADLPQAPRSPPLAGQALRL